MKESWFLSDGKKMNGRVAMRHYQLQPTSTLAAKCSNTHLTQVQVCCIFTEE